MSISSDLIKTVRELSALQARTDDVRRAQDRIENKLDGLIDRLSRVEANYNNLRENLKSQIMGDMKADLVRVQMILDEKGKRFALTSENDPTNQQGGLRMPARLLPILQRTEASSVLGLPEFGLGDILTWGITGLSMAETPVVTHH